MCIIKKKYFISDNIPIDQNKTYPLTVNEDLFRTNTQKMQTTVRIKSSKSVMHVLSML